MAKTEQTFAMIKPDAVKRNLIGAIINRFESRGLRVVAARYLKFSKELAASFYAEHEARPFFSDLVSYIGSAPVLALVLEGESAIARAREIMGATDPALAAPGTIRREFGVDLGKNSVHGSDSSAAAKREIGLLFDRSQIYQ